jgi:hypothetical protein
MPGSHFIQNNGERKDLRARVQKFPAYLFGRHVRGRTHHDARASQLDFERAKSRIIFDSRSLTLGI